MLVFMSFQVIITTVSPDNFLIVKIKIDKKLQKQVIGSQIALIGADFIQDLEEKEA